MTARPILFSGPMVRALLDGRKTQTRRVVKIHDSQYVKDRASGCVLPVISRAARGACPYGQPGDLLWVRESHRDAREAMLGRVLYKADGDVCCGWKPSIHMPRKLSRLTLRITDVRVQRLEEINELDAMAEGLVDLGIEGARWHWERDAKSGHFAPWRAYRALWESINGPGSWEANPWVWALTFDVIPANVDQVMP